MTNIFWVLVLFQMAMGGFDTVYHHELTERLAWRPAQMGELRLHGVRNLAYAVMFAGLGWSEPHGAAAVMFIILLIGETVITLWDFVEEDRTRKLPPTERLTHTLLTLNYGALLALLFPLLGRWAGQRTGVTAVYHGFWSWLCAAAAVGVIVSGLRDLAAAARAGRLTPRDAAPLAKVLTDRKAILVTGGTGFIGRRLVAALVAAGHDVTVLTRARGSASILPAPLRIITTLDQVSNETRIDAIINLAGESISDGPWTARKRRRILGSRLKMTHGIVSLIGRMQAPPSVLVSGSAIGWYGLRGEELLDERAAGADCFSRSVCVRWERAAMRAAAHGVRVVCLRTGLVLAADGGILSRMLVPFELGLGGPFGDGRQWISWIHRDDFVRLIAHTIATPTLSGALNGTAPRPVTGAAFAASLGRALGRPSFLAIPAAPLRLALGALAEELLLGGQRVVPRAALDSGFAFAYPDVDAALAAIVGNGKRSFLPAPQPDSDRSLNPPSAARLAPP